MSSRPEVSEAIRFYRANQPEQSRQILRDFLLRDPANIDALLWLAKVTRDPREAAAAAELALALEPQNEIAKRAVAAVQTQPLASTEPAPPVDILRLTGMTLSQARGVLWPFQWPEECYKRPIGVLLDEGRISMKNLGYAAESAFDSHVRQAARTMLLARLLGGELREPPSPLRVVEGYAYTAYQERQWLTFLGAVGGATLVLVAISIVMNLVSWLLQQTNREVSSGLTIIGFALLAIAYLGLRLGEHFRDRSRAYRAGREGEARAVDALRASLQSPWTLIHSLEWPDRKWGDVDLVLIGPGGVWVFEVKAFSGPIRISGEHWQYKTRRGWRTVRKSPFAQVRRNAQNVKEYLSQHGIPVKWVQAVVLWAGDDALTTDDPATPVWRISELPDRVEEFWHERRLNDAEVQQAADVFGKVIEKVKAKIAAETQPKKK